MICVNEIKANNITNEAESSECELDVNTILILKP